MDAMKKRTAKTEKSPNIYALVSIRNNPFKSLVFANTRDLVRTQIFLKNQHFLPPDTHTNAALKQETFAIKNNTPCKKLLF